MKMEKNIKYILIIILLVSTNIFAQEDSIPVYSIGINARVDKDSVILRWIPDKLNVLIFGFEKGYIIERAFVNENGTTGNYEKLSQTPIKRKDDNYWKSFSEKQNNEYNKGVLAFAYGLSSKEDPSKTIKEKDVLEKIPELKNQSDMRFALLAVSAELNAIAAEGLGLRFSDKNVKSGQTYSYRIYLSESISGYSGDTAYITVKIKEFEPWIFERDVIAAGMDKKIQLYWGNDSSIFAYHIEKFSEESQTYTRITKAPLMSMNKEVTDSSYFGFLDTNIVNYKEYKYKIIGISSFAEELYIGEVTGMGRDLTPPSAPFLSNPEQIAPNQVKLSWKIDNSATGDLKGFYIGRDTSETGPFTLLNKTILPPEQREYVDDSFSPLDRNFYIVLAVDTADNGVFSYAMYVPLIDSTAPPIPKWFSGSMDSNGVVTLVLERLNERGFMGFRILKANDPSHEFSSIIESFGADTVDYSKDTVFTDTVTLETTTKYVYYRATSLDFNYNESDLSEIIAIPRPDIIPPASPVITDVYITDTSVNLEYAPSFSEDTKYHIIYRIKEDGQSEDSISFSGPKDSFFYDSKIIPGETYKYYLVAVDSSNLRSNPCMAVVAKTLTDIKLPPVYNLKVELNENNNEPIIFWDYTVTNEEILFVIYRDFNNTGLKKFSTENDMSARRFQDKTISGFKCDVKYAVKVISKNGKESILSESVLISLK
jgi:uncharacterized protein